MASFDLHKKKIVEICKTIPNYETLKKILWFWSHLLLCSTWFACCPKNGTEYTHSSSSFRIIIITTLLSGFVGLLAFFAYCFLFLLKFVRRLLYKKRWWYDMLKNYWMQKVTFGYEGRCLCLCSLWYFLCVLFIRQCSVSLKTRYLCNKKKRSMVLSRYL